MGRERAKGPRVARRPGRRARLCRRRARRRVQVEHTALRPRCARRREVDVAHLGPGSLEVRDPYGNAFVLSEVGEDTPPALRGGGIASVLLPCHSGTSEAIGAGRVRGRGGGKGGARGRLRSQRAPGLRRLLSRAHTPRWPLLSRARTPPNAAAALTPLSHPHPCPSHPGRFYERVLGAHVEYSPAQAAAVVRVGAGSSLVFKEARSLGERSDRVRRRRGGARAGTGRVRPRVLDL